MITQFVYWINLWVTIFSSGLAQSFKPEQIVRRGPGSDLHCMSPLISAYDEFPDSAFSASSVLLNKTDFQPYQARLTDVYGSKEHTSGYAWCPNSMVNEMLREWIQAEFSDLVIIKSIFTAGRGDGNVKEFMPNFVLKYQREDNGTWYEHVKRDGTRILKANSDPRNLARATLDSVVIAKRIRIYPYSPKGSRDVCLRFALYGCKFPDGVVSYTIPQGGLRSQTSFHSPPLGDHLDPVVVHHLKDLSYDGQIITPNYLLTDGLGQLMDNVAFLGNLTRESDLHPSQPGFHFVGWPQTTQSEIELIFKFDTIRRFTWVRLFTFDSLILRVRLFAHATVAFSMDGKTFSNNVDFSTGRVQYYDPQMTTLSRVRRGQIVGHTNQRRLSPWSQHDPRIYADPEYGGAVVVELALGERMGRWLRLTLTAADSWTVLSEVQFNSTVVKSSQVVEVPAVSVQEKTETVALPPGIAHPAQEKGTSETQKGELHSKSDELSSGAEAKEPSWTETLGVPLIEDKPNVNDTEGRLATLLPIVIALGVLLFLLPMVVLIWLCSRRHSKRKQFKCRQKIHSVNETGRTLLHTAVGNNLNSPNVNEGAKLLGTGNSQAEGKPTMVSQICYSNGAHPPSMIQRLNDPNSSVATNNLLHSLSGTPGGGIGPGQNSIGNEKFEANSEASHLYSPTDGNYTSPEYASASIFEFPVQFSEAHSVAPTSGMEPVSATNYPPSFPPASRPHAVPTLPSDGTFSIYSGPASMPVGTGTLRPTSKHPTQNPNQRVQSTMAHHPAGLMFLGGIGIEDMDTLYQAVQPNTYNFPPEMGRPCNLYQPDQMLTAQHPPNGTLNLPESSNPWLLAPSNQPNPSAPELALRQAAWLTDTRGGTLRMFPNPVQHFPLGHTPGRISELNQLSPQISPQHYFPPQLIFKPTNQTQPQQQEFRSLAMPPSNNAIVPNGEQPHPEVTHHRGNPVGAASANVTYIPGVPDPNKRDGTNSGRLSIYSVCT